MRSLELLQAHGSDITSCVVLLEGFGKSPRTFRFIA